VNVRCTAPLKLERQTDFNLPIEERRQFRIRTWVLILSEALNWPLQLGEPTSAAQKFVAQDGLVRVKDLPELSTAQI
jgi:hypothetical protein